MFRFITSGGLLAILLSSAIGYHATAAVSPAPEPAEASVHSPYAAPSTDSSVIPTANSNLDASPPPQPSAPLSPPSPQPASAAPAAPSPTPTPSKTIKKSTQVNASSKKPSAPSPTPSSSASPTPTPSSSPKSSPAPQPAATPTPTPTSASPSTPAPVSPTPSLYVNPASSAHTQAEAWRSSRPTDAAVMDRLAAQPVATWFGDWNASVQTDADTYTNQALAQGKMPVLVAYNLPQRDCGGYSQGGVATGDQYLGWISSLAQGIGDRPAMVILEPDGLGLVSCLSTDQQNARFSLFSQAVSRLKSHPNTKVYLDAGHAGWIDSAEMARRLQAAGIAAADGFALNVSNFVATDLNTAYGHDLSSRLNNKHFLIDTSRNGLGGTSDNQWCNPSGRALGKTPTLSTGDSLIDAYLWIKTPGESDGNCNGGPSAGSWWPDYALGLASRANF